MRIQLFEESRDEINISITAQIESNEDLSITGNDSGKLVKELKGTWDYEYKVRIKKIDKELLIKKLSTQSIPINNDTDLMTWLKSNYSHNEAYTKFLNFLKEMGIKNDPFIWP